MGKHRADDTSGKGERNLSYEEEAAVAEEILGRPAKYSDTSPVSTYEDHKIKYDLDESYEDQAIHARETVKKTLDPDKLPENEK